MQADAADNTKPRRKRVLLLAFSCDPNRGAEYQVGWNRALQCAKHYDTWVLTSGDDNAESIQQFLATHGPIPGLHFEFVYSGAFEESLARLPGLDWPMYNLWHRRAYRHAQRLHEQHDFDLVHLTTNTSYREPGYCWNLARPFVWGPLGGTSNYNWRFLGEAGWRHGPREALRSMTNTLQLATSRRVRRAARRSQVVIAANSSVQHDLQRACGTPVERMLETGIARVTPPARPPLEHGGPLRILWSGRFAPGKALSLLLMALAKLPPEVAYELRVCGGGPMERRWRRLAHRLGVEARVQWLGWVPYHEAIEQFAWADVFVFTSLRDLFGNVNLEALANGVPVVCLDHQGVHDVVTPQCGIKVPVTTPQTVVDDLRDALARLAQDPALARSMSDAALARAREYLWDRQGERMRAIYQRALGEPDPQPNPPHEPVAATTPGSVETNGVHQQVANGAPAPTHTATAGRRVSAEAKHVAKRAVASLGSRLNQLAGSRGGPQRGILMYHRMAEPASGVEPPTWNVAPDAFRQQLVGLLERGFEPWSLSRLIQAGASGAPLPPRLFVVTFDDGYESVYRHAWPILTELNVPATLFLPTAYIGSQQAFPYDDWSCAGSPRVPQEAWRLMNDGQCRELADSGLVELGAHTHTHEDFSGREDAFQRDLTCNLEQLQARFGLRQVPFAFPFGQATSPMLDVVRRLGLSCGLTTAAVPIDPRTAPFGWGRFNVEPWDSAATLAAKLGGWCSWAWQLRNRLSRAPHTASTPG